MNLHYLAGFLDGEGCFTYYNGPVIECGNTYLPVLEQMQQLFGGSVSLQRDDAGYKALHRWRITGAKAAAVARQLLPYLKEKREQAAVLTRMMRYPKGSAMRDRLIQRLKEMKRG